MDWDSRSIHLDPDQGKTVSKKINEWILVLMDFFLRLNIGHFFDFDPMGSNDRLVIFFKFIYGV